MVLFEGLTCGPESAAKIVLLNGWVEAYVTGQKRSLQVSYAFSTKTDIEPGQW